MIANSSARLPPSGLGRLPNTPTTVYCVRPMRTCLPIGSAVGEERLAGRVAEHDDVAPPVDLEPG